MTCPRRGDFCLEIPLFLDTLYNTISINEILSCYRTNNQQANQQIPVLNIEIDDNEKNKPMHKDEVEELEDWLDDVL